MTSRAVGQGGPYSARRSRSGRAATSGCTSPGSATTRARRFRHRLGEGCYVYDADGKRYLDGLSALYCVNAGHGRPELAAAAAAQMRELDFFTTWSYAHPRAIELAERIAALAPGDLNRVFFTSGGSEAVESAIKLSRNYHRLTGHGQKTKVIAREIAYHGTSLGALSVTGITSVRSQFEPLTPGGCHVPNTDSYRWPEGRDPLWAASRSPRGSSSKALRRSPR